MADDKEVVVAAAPSRAHVTAPFDPHVREASKIKALRDRMENGLMTDEDVKKIELCRVLRQKRSEGWSYEKIAGTVGHADGRRLCRLEKSPTYRFLERCFESERHLATTAAGTGAVEQARLATNALATDRTEFLKWCFRKDKEGDWADPGMAMWASDRVDKTTGLDTPPGGKGDDGAGRPISVGTMNVIVHQTVNDDADIARLHREAVNSVAEVLS